MTPLDVIQSVTILAKELEAAQAYGRQLEAVNVQLQEEIAHLKRERDWRTAQDQTQRTESPGSPETSPTSENSQNSSLVP